jgi:prolipoprotein diacylglyceryltransferase
MRPVLMAWLAAHGLPAWLAPDYVTMVGAASLLGAWLVLRLAERDGARVDVQARALLVAYGAALVGGYLFEWIRAVPDAITHRSFAPIAFAGRAAYGGLLFGLAAPIVWLRRRRAPVADFLDRATIAMGIAYGAVRVGCFLEGCDYGSPTGSWLGVRFPAFSLAADAHARAGWVPPGAASLPVHPTELYESALGLFATLLALVPLRRGRRDGTAFAVWLATYASGRFVIELLRGDGDRGLYGSLSTAQWVSIGLLLALVIALRPSVRARWATPAVTVGVALLVMSHDVHAAPAAPLPPPQPPSAPPTPTQPPPDSPPPLPPSAPLPTPTVADDNAEAFARSERRHRDAMAANAAPRIFVVRSALVVSAVLGRPDVPSGAAGELDGMYRFRVGPSLRADLGLEGRLFENAVARHYSLGLVGEFAFEVGRRFDLTLTLVPHHTWFAFKSDFFSDTNAYGIRYAAGAQLTLADRVVLGATPLAFTTTSSTTVGVITQWEPRLWVGVLF